MDDNFKGLRDLGASIVRYAPALGAALAPATGGVSAMVGTGIAVLGKIFGLGDAPTPDALQNAIAQDPQAALKLALADREFQLAEYKAETDRLQVLLDDVKSARDREKSVKDYVNRNLAYVIILAFIGVVAFTLAGMVKVESVLAGTLIGYLSAKAEQVLAYYFGSSKGSTEKTNLLAKAEPIK